MRFFDTFWSSGVTVDGRLLVSLFAVVLVFILVERFGR
jgi:hypothetical protein